MLMIALAALSLIIISVAVKLYGDLENPIMAWAAGVIGSRLRGTMIALTRYGRLPFWLVVAAVLAMLGKVAAAAALVSSIALSILIGRIVKEAVRRPRPYERMPLNAVPAGGSSFPSNHCSVVWGASLLVSSLFGIQLAVPFIVEAFLVSTSRVLLLAHYPSDCVGGLAIGIISWRVGLMVYHIALGLLVA